MKKILQAPVFLIITLLFVFNSGSMAQMSILLVDDNGYDPSRVVKIQTALTNNSVSYTNYGTVAQGGSPTYAYMSGFDLVIWYTGNDGAGLSFWNGNDSDNQHIKDYIDNGGMFWLQGLDFLYDRYGGAPDSFSTGDFVYDYLGIEVYQAQSHVDDGVYSDGVPQLDVVSGNPIFTYTPMLWSYSTLYYADALVPSPSADSIYRMGPTGYDFDTCYNSIYIEKGTGKVLSIAAETARINTQTNTDTYIGQGLTYFAQFVPTSILITDITVYGTGNATTINIDGGTLQMNASILPTNATNQTLTWSVVDGTTTASIDQNGLLQSTGTPSGNGTVWVFATAADGSGVVGSVEISISNQGTG
ncbi:MAG: Ig-like domain-containing protein, partial [Bacteroidota bacterium]|nr:Ig-like domain-containing protein [Bacteroidota bacterium]